MAKRSRPRGKGRSSRSARGFLARRWPLLLIAVGLALLLYGGAQNYFYDRSIQPAIAVQSATPAVDKPAIPVRLTVPGLLDEPLEPQSYKDGQWTVSERVGSYLSQSAKPGGDGNVIIYGHNKEEIFGPLLRLEGSGPVVVTTDDGTKHRYRVVKRQEVAPDQTELLQPTDTEVLTIYTCSGWLDSKRYVIRAEPI